MGEISDDLCRLFRAEDERLQSFSIDGPMSTENCFTPSVLDKLTELAFLLDEVTTCYPRLLELSKELGHQVTTLKVPCGKQRPLVDAVEKIDAHIHDPSSRILHLIQMRKGLRESVVSASQELERLAAVTACFQHFPHRLCDARRQIGATDET
ncbi:hypothetical protein CSKR_107144 [Clonorchis sinensis]|uniref:Uncharacterized protein n=1 Tax=Clonorchis sinensis TaxID=79923 RepID=A0A8T1M1G4_CLOSI|nr:hypothetical protein CSKR_107144 [Clonorchis sinensis]